MCEEQTLSNSVENLPPSCESRRSPEEINILIVAADKSKLVRIVKEERAEATKMEKNCSSSCCLRECLFSIHWMCLIK